MRYVAVGLLAVWLLALAGCASVSQLADKDKPPTQAVLQAPRVQTPPRVDGRLDDGAWRRARQLTVETAGGPKVELKAVRTADRIYVQARWLDSTKNDLDSPWRYDGVRWTNGSPDDVLVLFWNIENSIKDFNTRGAAAVQQQPRPEAAIKGLYIEGERPKRGLWAGKDQRGDVWDLALGLSNPLGKANDLYFAIDPDYLRLPAVIPPRITVQHDEPISHMESSSSKMPWIKNRLVVSGSVQPKYRFKDGLTYLTRPYPTMADVVEIASADRFEAGDVIPYYIYGRSKTSGTSMDDVAAKGAYKDGLWTAELARKLDTSHKDDIQFTLKPGKNYFVFSVMIRDGGSKYYSSPPISLELEAR